jgi:hypothetical protein
MRVCRTDRIATSPSPMRYTMWWDSWIIDRMSGRCLTEKLRSLQEAFEYSLGGPWTILRDVLEDLAYLISSPI